jgi:CRP-like cAMP-binding protein
LPQPGESRWRKPPFPVKTEFFRACPLRTKLCCSPILSLSTLHFDKFWKPPNRPIPHSYFIGYGLASIIAKNSHKRLEVGLIGCDGFTGLPIVGGNDRSPHETFMQVPGEAMRISANKLRQAISQSPSLQRALLKFAHAFMNQTANTISNGTATLEERLARWLLMANDRLRGDEIPLTHEFLSLMLGVRRAGVTVALHYLENRGLINLARKQITVTDRDGLKAAANGTYHSPEKMH